MNFLPSLFIALTVDWRIALIIGLVFFAVYMLTKYVSLGSVLAAVTFGLGFVFFYHNDLWTWLTGEERKTDLFSKGKKQ